MDVPERFEQVIAYVTAHLPAPIEQRSGADGSILFTAGTPGEVVVHLTRTSVIVSEYSGEWETPYSFSVRPRRIGAIKWRRLPETELLNALGHLIRGAREVRRARYRTCRFCAADNPPEWMDSDNVCAVCSARQMDLVH
jgi:hypothetical protein